MDSALQIGQMSIDTATLVQKLLQYRLLEKFVQETIIDEIIDGVACEPSVAIEIFCRERKLTTEEQRQSWCQKEHFTRKQMEDEAVREFRLHHFKEETWGDRIKTLFLQRKDQLDRVIYSFIRTKNAELAYELFFRLRDDDLSFATVAKKYSEGTEAQTGGLVGPVELSVPHPTLAKMLRVSHEGQLWEPTKIGDWLIIVRCEKLIPAKLDDAMRQRILNEQFQSLLQERMLSSPVKLAPSTRGTKAKKTKSEKSHKSEKTADNKRDSEESKHSKDAKNNEILPDSKRESQMKNKRKPEHKAPEQPSSPLAAEPTCV